ncbi:hypothetical protein HOK00_10630 [bacterium]|nr:hypothetical protein [bacterium]
MNQTLNKTELETLKQKYNDLITLEKNLNADFISVEIFSILEKSNELYNYDFETASYYDVNIANVYDAYDVSHHLSLVKDFIEENKDNNKITKEINILKDIVSLF